MTDEKIKAACVLLENYLDDNIDSLSDDVLQTVLEAARRYAASQQTRGEVPEGWKLVPIEPTAEMIASIPRYSNWEMVWNAMLTASPTPPVAGKEMGE